MPCCPRSSSSCSARALPAGGRGGGRGRGVDGEVGARDDRDLGARLHLRGVHGHDHGARHGVRHRLCRRQLGRRLGRVVDDRLGFPTHRWAVADGPDVETERLQALRGRRRLVVGAGPVQDGHRHRRRRRQRAARVRVLAVRFEAEELVDGVVVLRLSRELDVPVAPTLVHVVAELVHRHRHGELRCAVDVDVVVPEDQADHVGGREARVNGELSRRRPRRAAGR